MGNGYIGSQQHWEDNINDDYDERERRSKDQPGNREQPDNKTQPDPREPNMEFLEYVLKFALEVIEDNDLQNTKNKDNWKIGESIDQELEKLNNKNN